MKVLIYPLFLMVCILLTGCSNDDEPKNKTKDIIMSVSEEMGIMYDLFDSEWKHPIPCLRVMDEDFPGEWRNLSVEGIEGFDYQMGHMYTLKVRRTILANPPADGSSYTYRLLKILEDRVWPPVSEPEEEIIVDKEEDIPYANNCPYHIYDLYKDAFVIDDKGDIHYAGYKDGDIILDLSFAAVHFEFAIPKDSEDFLEFNRIDKMAYYAYVVSPLTDKIEKVTLHHGAMYFKDFISESTINEIASKYESGKTLKYDVVPANVHGYGLQKVSFTIAKK